MATFSFLILGANSPWTYGLAEALAQRHVTHAVHFYDWRTYRRIRPTWSSRTPPVRLQRSIEVFPTGYAGRLEILFRFYLQRLIQQWYQRLEQQSDSAPWVMVTEPHFASWVFPVADERLIYYNFDDYVLYRPDRKTKILQQETELIERAAITLCAAYSQWEFFQKRYPQQASNLFHYPHGVVESFLNPHSEAPPEAKTVGYVGSLGDRLDWSLIGQIIQTCTDITFVFVGGRDDRGSNHNHWQAAREAVLNLPNVRHVDKVPSDHVPQYYWSFAVNWIPYRVDHPFNRAACPTKIMDGIASGRPVLSTDIPECRLYPDWITIFSSLEEARHHIYQQLSDSMLSRTDRSELQLQFAQQQTWPARVQMLENWLVGVS